MAHITVGDVTPVDSYTATAGQTQFTVSFPFFTDASLQVYKTLAGATANDATDLLTLSTHYTVTGAGNVEGATKRITLQSGSAAAEGDKIVIRRNEPAARTTDLQEQGDFLASTFNDEQDLVIMLIQQIEELVGRSITKGVTGGSWEGQSTRISSVADPVDTQDAATKNYVATEVASQVTALGSFALPTVQGTSVSERTWNAVANTTYFLPATAQGVTRTVTLPLTPADGTFVRFYVGLNRGNVIIKTQGDDVIFTNGSRHDDEYTATGDATGTLTDSGRDGSSARNREFVTNALVGQQLLNTTTGNQANITANTANTISASGLQFTTNDQYRVGYDSFEFGTTETTDNPTPSFISLSYSAETDYWMLEASGDARGIPYNTNKEKHATSNTPGTINIDGADSIEQAVSLLAEDFYRISNGRVDGSLRLIDQDAASATADNAQAPVFIHYNLTDHRTVTLSSQSGGVEYHIVNGTEGTGKDITLAAGTSVTHITLIKSGSVTHTSASVKVPTGSSCKIRPIASSQWIVYDADAAVVKI